MSTTTCVYIIQDVDPSPVKEDFETISSTCTSTNGAVSTSTVAMLSGFNDLVLIISLGLAIVTALLSATFVAKLWK